MSMKDKLNTEAVQELMSAILTLDNYDDCLHFFEDLCTVNELQSIAQRFEVASMLYDKQTYLDITEKTGASTATISRVNRSLNYGAEGYEAVFSKLKDR